MKLNDIIALVLLSAIWGAAFLFMRIAAPLFGPLPLVLIRVGSAAGFLLLLVFSRRRSMLSRSHWRHLAMVGIFNSALPFCLLAFASLSLGAGFNSLLNALTPVMAAMVGFVWLGQKPSPNQWLGFMTAFGGVAYLGWDGIYLKCGSLGLAVLAAVGAALSYGYGANYSRQYLTGISPTVATAGTMLFATLIMLPLGICFWPAKIPAPGAWVAALMLGIICTGVAYTLYYHLITVAGSNQAASATFLVPIFAAIWSGLILHERVTGKMLVSAGIIFCGTALALNIPGISLLRSLFSRTVAPAKTGNCN